MQEIISPYDGVQTRSGREFSRPNKNKVYIGPVVWNEMIPGSLKKCDTLENCKAE